MTQFKWGNLRRIDFSKFNTIIVLLVLVVFGAVRYNTFLSEMNIMNILRQSSMLGFTSIGMTFVLLSGGVDLSVGSYLALSGVIIVKMSSGSIALAIVTALFITTALGLVNGILVSNFNVAPFIATLCTMMATRGVVQIMTERRPIQLDKINAAQFYDFEGTRIFNIPLPFLLFLLAVFVASIFLYYTRFGRNVYAIGGSPESARMMGLPVLNTKLAIYSISGFLSGISGLIMCSRMGAAYPLAGEGWEMSAIAAAVLGGALMSGGVGNVWGSLFGTLIMIIIGNLINSEGTLGTAWQNIINGAALLIAVLLMEQQKSQMNKLILKESQNLA